MSPSTLELSHITGLQPRTKREKKAHGFVMRPLKALAWQVAYQRQGKPFGISVVTKGVKEDLQFAWYNKKNVIVIAEGEGGGGKTWLGWFLAQQWTKLSAGKIQYSWDVDNIPDLQDGDWFHLDEFLEAEGEGKIQMLNRFMKNILPTVREKQICISVSTPRAPDMPFYTFLATTLSQDLDKRINMFQIRYFLPRYGLVYIGNAVFPEPEDTEKWRKFQKKSYTRKTRIVDDKGRKTIERKLDYEECAQTVRDWAKEKKYTLLNRGQAETAAKQVAKEQNWDTSYYSVEDIANLVIMSGKVRLPDGAMEGTIPDYEGQTTDLRKAICDRMIEAYGIDELGISVLNQYYLENENQTRIGERLGVTQATISNLVGQGKKRRGKIPLVIGFALEDVYLAKRRAEGKTMKGAKKNSPEPDALELDEKGAIIRCYSIKCHLNQKQFTISRRQIAQEELELHATGVPLTIVVYDYIEGTLHEVPYKGQDTIAIKKKK